MTNDYAFFLKKTMQAVLLFGKVFIPLQTEETK